MDYTVLYEILNEIQLDNNQVLKCIMAALYVILLIHLFHLINGLLDIIISVIQKFAEKRKKVSNNG